MLRMSCRRLRRLVPFFACALVALAIAPAAAPAKQVPGQYIVVLDDGADVGAVVADHTLLAQAQVLHVYRHALLGYSAKLSATGLEVVRADPRVASVVQDQEAQVVQGKPSGGGTGTTGWPPPPPGGWVPTGVDRMDADLSTARSGDGTGSVDVGIGIFDTGVDPHSDLNIAGGVNCVIGIANDGTYGDEFGHGTHVAGIAGALDDANGIVGVAPGAPLWSVRVAAGGGVGNGSSQLCGIDWVTGNAAANGIKVVNASMALLGSPDDGNCGYNVNDVMHQAICRSVEAGVTWVFATGNGAGYYNNVAGASYDEVLSVTALADSDGRPGAVGPAFPCSVARGTTDDKHAMFSNWAINAADFEHTINAPGTCIQSTWLNGLYETRSGTSMAAPHAAGLVALCMAAGQCAGTPAETIQKVRADSQAHNQANPGFGFTGDPLRPITGRYYGYLAAAPAY